MTPTTPIVAIHDYDRRHLASVAQPPVAPRRQKRARVLLRTLDRRRWGWIDSRGYHRMHLRSLGDACDELPLKIDLEERGVRIFEVVGLLDFDELATIKRLVTANRPRIERSWATHMIERGWIKSAVNGDHLFLVANADSTNAYRRVVNLRDFGCKRLDEPGPKVRYDLESCAVVIKSWAESPLKIDFPEVLFRDSWAA